MAFFYLFVWASFGLAQFGLTRLGLTRLGLTRLSGPVAILPRYCELETSVSDVAGLGSGVVTVAGAGALITGLTGVTIASAPNAGWS